MVQLVLIFLGSGLGGVLRYAVSGWAQRFVATFPLGTLAVNALGCLVMGFLSAAFAERWLVREEHRIALLVGVLGGFTTFSAFGMETFAFLADGQFGRALANVLLNVVLGIAAVWAGYRLAQISLGV